MLAGFENLIEIQSIMQKIAYSLILFSSTTNMTYYYVSIWGWIWLGKGICLLFFLRYIYSVKNYYDRNLCFKRSIRNVIKEM